MDRRRRSGLNRTNRLTGLQTRKGTTALASRRADGKCRCPGPSPCHWDENLGHPICKSIPHVLQCRVLEQYCPAEHSAEVEIKRLETVNLMGLFSPSQYDWAMKVQWGPLKDERFLFLCGFTGFLFILTRKVRLSDSVHGGRSVWHNLMWLCCGPGGRKSGIWNRGWTVLFKTCP